MDALRSALQPVTHNLPGPIRDIGLSLIGESCYKKLILDIDLENNPECVKLGISKALGIGIVAASSIVKVPQILKLVNSKSASGVSFLSYLLETSSLLTSLAYNVRNGFPFSTFGETALILGQNVIISVLVLKYSGRAGIAALFVAALAVGVASLFSEQLLNMQQLSYLQAGAGVLGVASKVPQIVAILQEGGTGQLSAFAVFNYLAGSLSRIFTTLQEVDDKLILYGFIAGFALNLVLALQMVYYWNAPSAKARGKQKVPAGPIPPTLLSATATGASTSAEPRAKSKGPTTRRRG
ncbi:mannose-P-dolichol utilization defect 1 protein [Sordaria brevicollis]|uniref:Mannose-P-dolichol utilization defect 1 protein homolog n=1 Tax=Sordaria brevicollis TaxID=83679 RepID=A0AAE0PE29_SORBR|nr:mannose-P-dolichol utilization defect 1 protein [Sordaria brevicollis]